MLAEVLPGLQHALASARLKLAVVLDEKDAEPSENGLGPAPAQTLAMFARDYVRNVTGQQVAVEVEALASAEVGTSMRTADVAASKSQLGKVSLDLEYLVK